MVISVKLLIAFFIMFFIETVIIFILVNKNRELLVNIKEMDSMYKLLKDKVKNEVQKNIDKEAMMLQQSKLAQMGELLGMVAHQWRQPLGLIRNTILLMQIDIAQKRAICLNQVSDTFCQVNNYVKFLTATIDDFMDFYKPSRDKEMVNITTPVDDTLKMLNNLLEKSGVVVVKRYQANRAIPLYKSEIVQVLLNIIKNSEDNFLERKIANPRIYIETKKKRGDTVISIKDNGGGIDEKILPKIFDPYFSTKSKKSGIGIGLHMSKIIVEEHNNGKLDVYNTRDGVCFELIF